MTIRDLFKSVSERKKEKERKRRRAIRRAESIVDDVKMDIANLKKEREKKWHDARNSLRDGQRAAAQRWVQSCRAIELEIFKLEKRQWTFEQINRKLKNAAVDVRMGDALGELAEAIEIDPDVLEDRLADVDDKLMDLMDNDMIWEKSYRREMQGVETKEEEAILTLEDMEKQLQDEVAADLSAPRPIKESGEGETGPSVKQQISEGRRRLKELLEGDK